MWIQGSMLPHVLQESSFYSIACNKYPHWFFHHFANPVKGAWAVLMLYACVIFYRTSIVCSIWVVQIFSHNTDFREPVEKNKTSTILSEQYKLDSNVWIHFKFPMLCLKLKTSILFALKNTTFLEMNNKKTFNLYLNFFIDTVYLLQFFGKMWNYTHLSFKKKKSFRDNFILFFDFKTA